MENLSLEKIKQDYPNEWILLGNPVIEKTKLISGEVLFHSKNKQETCTLGAAEAAKAANYTLFFTGALQPVRKIGVFKKL